MPTKIEWADDVWNPVWGCLNDCPYCYAKKIAKRFGKTDDERCFTPCWRESAFHKKFSKKTKRVFVNSMSDIMYWNPEWMQRVLDRIATMPEIDFIFLTKGGIDAYPKVIQYPANCIIGFTATVQEEIPSFIPIGYCSGARLLLNVEPILAPFDTDVVCKLSRYDWLIVGAETGNRANAVVVPDSSWYQRLICTAIIMKIPVFIKPSLANITPSDLYRQEYPLK